MTIRKLPAADLDELERLRGATTADSDPDLWKALDLPGYNAAEREYVVALLLAAPALLAAARLGPGQQQWVPVDSLEPGAPGEYAFAAPILGVWGMGLSRFDGTKLTACSGSDALCVRLPELPELPPTAAEVKLVQP